MVVSMHPYTSNGSVFFDIPLACRVNLRIQSEYRKIRTRNNSVFGHFSRSEEFQNYLGLQPKAHFLIQKKEIFLKAVKTCSKQRYQTFP